MSVFTRGPYGRLAVMLNTLSSINIEIIIIIIIIIRERERERERERGREGDMTADLEQ